MKYRIIVEIHSGKLADEVNSAIEKGWRVHGSLQVSMGLFAQAMLIDDAPTEESPTKSDLLDGLCLLVNLHDGIDDGGIGITNEDWRTVKALIAKAYGNS